MFCSHLSVFIVALPSSHLAAICAIIPHTLRCSSRCLVLLFVLCTLCLHFIVAVVVVVVSTLLWAACFRRARVACVALSYPSR